MSAARRRTRPAAAAAAAAAVADAYDADDAPDAAPLDQAAPVHAAALAVPAARHLPPQSAAIPPVVPFGGPPPDIQGLIDLQWRQAIDSLLAAAAQPLLPTPAVPPAPPAWAGPYAGWSPAATDIPVLGSVGHAHGAAFVPPVHSPNASVDFSAAAASPLIPPHATSSAAAAVAPAAPSRKRQRDNPVAPVVTPSGGAPRRAAAAAAAQPLTLPAASSTASVFSPPNALGAAGPQRLPGGSHPVVASPIVPAAAASSSPASVLPLSAHGASIPTYDASSVLFMLHPNGKVEVLPNSAQSRRTYAGLAREASAADFAIFKNAGKSTASNKVTDPVTAARYAFDKDGGQFYEWDKSVEDHRGAGVSARHGAAANQLLLDRLARGELVNRAREDRTREGLLPFDVGTYTASAELDAGNGEEATVLRPLSSRKAWTTAGKHVNRDHVPSGASLKGRGGGQAAYARGVTIAIPNVEMHQTFSPTFGTDNSNKNGVEDAIVSDSGAVVKGKRVHLDAANPALAVHRDIASMLDQTRDRDYSQSIGGHKMLDLRVRENRIRQVGAYRNLYRRNVQANELIGDDRGLDPAVDGYEFETHDRAGKSKSARKGSVTYRPIARRTQGDVTVAKLLEELQKAGGGKPVK